MARSGVAILSSIHDVADARIHRHVAALVEQGLTVELWGTGNPAGAPAGVSAVHVSPRSGMLTRALKALLLPWRTRARILISVDPDVAVATRIACAFKRRTLHVADVHEDYRALLRDRSWARGGAAVIGRAIAAGGERAAISADLTAVADDHLVPSARHRVVVRNVPVLTTPPTLDATPRAVYVGDLRQSRGLLTMLDALALAPGWELDLVGPVAAADAALLDARLSQLGSRVRFHGRLDPTSAWRLAGGAWAGFSLLDETPAFLRATPSKLYEYVAMGIPVIATGLPPQVALITASGAGVIAADAEQVAGVLREWEQHPERVTKLRAAAVAWAKDAPVYQEGSTVLAREVSDLGGL